MTRALPEHAVGATLVTLSCNRGVTGCNPGAHVYNFVATRARLGATLVRHGRSLRQKPGVTCVWPGRYLGCDLVWPGLHLGVAHWRCTQRNEGAITFRSSPGDAVNLEPHLLPRLTFAIVASHARGS